MSKVNQAPNCGAWVPDDFSPVKDARLTCVLAAGHYVEADEGAGAKSWHTDCPNVPGMMYPLEDHDHRHLGNAPFTCTYWSDERDGAHPSDVAEPVAVPLFTPAITGDYEAHVVIGGASLRARGPHRVISNLIRAFADAFEEEVER